MKVGLRCGEEEIAAFGLTCSPAEPCPVYPELAAVEPVGNRIFASGNLHTASITLWSLLLASADGGKTWTEPFERLPSCGLEQIQFIDFQSGWIAGQHLAGLPRDPFFLLTTDGGQTWRRRPVFSETQVGTLTQFTFESRQNGSLLIDRTQASETGARYELHETMTGGESWSIREVSARPLALKRPRLPNPDWRVRPDAATRSYRIERRQGEQWVAVASFLIEAGACTLPEPVLTEPPPPPTNPDEGVDVLVVPSRPGAVRKPPSLKKKKP